MEEDGIKTSTSPQICCHITLWKVDGHLHIFTAQLIQFIVMKKCLIMVNVHEGCYFFLYVHRVIYIMCLKCLPLGTNACLELWMALVNGCASCALFNAVPNVYLHNWKEWVMQRTKYYSNVIMMLVSGRKINKNSWNRCCLRWSMLFSLIMNVKLCNWPFTFRKIVRQQIWGEVAVVIPASSANLFWI